MRSGPCSGSWRVIEVKIIGDHVGLEERACFASLKVDICVFTECLTHIQITEQEIWLLQRGRQRELTRVYPKPCSNTLASFHSILLFFKGQALIPWARNETYPQTPPFLTLSCPHEFLLSLQPRNVSPELDLEWCLKGGTSDTLKGGEGSNNSKIKTFAFLRRPELQMVNFIYIYMTSLLAVLRPVSWIGSNKRENE